MKFDCDDLDLQRSLQNFECQVSRLGGWLNERLTIRSQNGEIRVETPPDLAEHEEIMSIPEACLLPVDDVQWRLSRDQLRIESFNREMPPERRELFATVVEIYNLTHKIGTHKNRSPGIALADDPCLLACILKARDRIHENAELSVPPVIESFFQSRIFAFNYGRRSGDVLMPFIDFLNHHSHATGYQRESVRHPKEPVIAALNSRPIANSSECFVRYGTFDGYDLLNAYAFVEESCPFVRSVPLTIQLEKLGEIRVQATDTSHPHHARLNARNPGPRALNDLLIPDSQNPHSLRRVLARCIDSVTPHLSQHQQATFVEEAERQVIAANLAYYQELQSLVRLRPIQVASGLPIYALVARLATLQLRRLHGYQSLTMADRMTAFHYFP